MYEYLFGSDSCLYTAGNGINSGSHTEVVEGLVFLPDCILTVYPGHLHVALLDGFLELCTLGFLLLVTLFGIPFKFLDSKLELEEVV